ncbi:hypothetical protein J4471_00995 [Candidatus Woesearchaeota archaeon]|nr:hypothetical protein [Candidatus Woesearchaeota archaeon]
MPIDDYLSKLQGFSVKPKRVNIKIKHTNLEDLDRYIILEGRIHGSYSYPDLLVSLQKCHFGLTWEESQLELLNDNSIMLTIRQYVDFLNLLYSDRAFTGNGKRINNSRAKRIFHNITSANYTFEGEWLDAKFKIIDNTLKINHTHKILNEQLNPLSSEEIENPNNPNDKIISISLMEWLLFADIYGLPKLFKNEGNFYYFPPVHNSVACFESSTFCRGVHCNYDLGAVNAGLGVRPSFIK